MSCSVRVLTNIKEEWGDWNKETLADPERRRSAVITVRDSLKAELEEDYAGLIWYIREHIPDMGPKSNQLIFGCERPDDIRELVKNWNYDNAERCIDQVMKLEDAARKNGFQTISDYLKADISENGCIGLSLYTLRKAMDAADGIFTYGSPSCLARLQYKNPMTGFSDTCNSVLLDSGAKSYVLAHPEEYVLIELMYN